MIVMYAYYTYTIPTHTHIYHINTLIHVKNFDNRIWMEKKSR